MKMNYYYYDYRTLTSATYSCFSPTYIHDVLKVYEYTTNNNTNPFSFRLLSD